MSRLSTRGMLATMLLAISACVAPDDRHAEATRLTGGDPDEGRGLIIRYGCAACHTIDGIPSARGLVGPSLNGIRERPFVAGERTHDVESIVSFIADPKQVDSTTVMPDLGLDETQARHVVSYLYTTRN
jgi:cytochrome c2